MILPPTLLEEKKKSCKHPTNDGEKKYVLSLQNVALSKKLPHT